MISRNIRCLAVAAALLAAGCSAWAFNQTGTIYFDNSEAKWSNVYFWIGNSGGDGDNPATLASQMTLVSGTQYLYTYTRPNQWSGAEMWFFSNTNTSSTINTHKNIRWKWASIGNADKVNGPVTHDYTAAYTNNYVYPTNGKSEASQEWGGTTYKFQAYKYGTCIAYDEYAVTVNNNDSRGTVSLTDFAGTAVASGDDKPYLTVLNIAVQPASGYQIASVVINGTDYTNDFESCASGYCYAYTMKAATTITVTYRHKPTVLIGENESVNVAGDEVTLNGYIPYKACKTISEYGFVYKASNEGDPVITTDTKVIKGASDVSERTYYTSTFSEDAGTYYYRAYMVADGTAYYSEKRSFTLTTLCNVQSAVTALINGAATASVSKTATNITLSTQNHADTYSWACTSKPEGASNPVITGGSTRNAVIASIDNTKNNSTYQFTLTASCSGGSNVSSTVSLYVCDPAAAQTVLLDNHTANIICVGETSVATCVSQEGYTYSLYHGNDMVQYSQVGTGRTLTWSNVGGEGTFYVKSSPSAFLQCAVPVGSATQSYNNPSVDILSDPGLSVVAYKAITLSKGASSTIDGNPTWSITSGTNGYLLNETTKLLYDSRAREKVIFKGGLNDGSAANYTVTATGSRTVEISGSTDKKTCEGTGSVNIVVSPAVNGCN